MSKTEKFLGLGVLIAIVIAVGAFLSAGSREVVSVGAVAPTDISSTNFTQLTASDGLAVGNLSQFQVGPSGSLVQGGGVSATTTNGSATLTYSLFDTENVIKITQNVGGSMTATLPATSLVTKLVNIGDTFKILINNATTTASQPITLAAGANMQIKVASSSSSGGLASCVLNSLDSTWLTFILATSTTFTTVTCQPIK